MMYSMVSARTSSGIVSPSRPNAIGIVPPGRAYFETYARQGKEPHVGRHLVSLLHEAGALPQRNRCLFFGTCSGHPNFEMMVANFAGIIEGIFRQTVQTIAIRYAVAALTLLVWVAYFGFVGRTGR